MSGPNPVIPNLAASGQQSPCDYEHIRLAGVSVASQMRRLASTHLEPGSVEGITAAEVIDGEVERIKAVRRQIGGAADWIKWVSQTAKSAFIPAIFRLRFSRPLRTAHWNVNGANVASGSGFHTVERGYSMLFDGEDSDHLKVYNGNMPPTMPWPRHSRISGKLPAGLPVGNPEGRRGHRVRRRYGNAQPRRERSGDEAYGAAGGTTGEWGTLSGWERIGSMAWEGKAGAERLDNVESLQE
ncbi:uncharacterized protein LAESUDRAFT_752340 [Laetiporus sulphureus 93-53]|uniref:Uncharacterized protein n=1 Tax=Laetiporus sulphureus 93-53 TaxID=1314785 RepID=A0A165C213_9APHY|nr:uncharacterized protein LAESUDRAFT_752340 [Laetiporus sulphureus 93-53]KZT02059.1 hypothetical protein LAESUDRAFT_752340 [Laetiporus sulphureus 93-53]